MAKPKVTEREVRLARSFLKTVNGNQTNTYLLLAVIAWMRAMAKAHDPYWKSLSKYSAVQAGVLLARKLVARAKADGHNYKGVIASLRHAAKGDKGLASQALDFLAAIELSKWDRKHYGYVPYVEGHFEQVPVYGKPGQVIGYNDVWVPTQYEQDPLAQAWAKLTDHPGIPTKWYTDTVITTRTRVIPPRPQQPRSLLHVLPTVAYIQPYEAQRFYDAKPHYGSNVLTDG